MKIAVCLSGYVRTLFECLPITIDNIHKKNSESKIEVYAAFWDNSYGRTEKINDPHHTFSSLKLPDPIDKEEVENFFLSCNHISSTKIAWLKYDINLEMTKRGESFSMNPPALLSQYYAILESWKLANKSDADHFFRLRPDVVLYNPPTLECSTNEVILNSNVWYNCDATTGHENEMFWIASKDAARRSFSQFQRICDGELRDHHMHGEAITGRHFASLGTRISRHNFDYRVKR